MNLPHVELLLLAQTAPAASPSATTAPADAAMIPLLALKRWFGSATLASPIGTPSKVAVWAWLTGLGGLLVMAILAQGPAKAFAQLLDLGGLMRLVSAGIGRLKRSGRLVAILLAATVVSWTAWQTPLHNVQEKKEDLALLLKSKSRAEFAGEQGTLAALTPLRDLLDMGDNLILLVATATLVFKFSADRWGRFDDSSVRGRAAGGWTTVCWGGAGLYAMYRVASHIKDIEGFPPLGGCLFIEVAVVPVLMLLADGLLLAWVLVELRGVTVCEDDSGFDVAGTIAIVPASILACLVGMPARYVATTVGLAVFHDHLPKAMIGSPWILTFLRGWGLVWLQSASLTCVGIVGAVAWSSGSWGNALKGYGRMLKADGGRLVAIIAWIGVAVGTTSMLAYFAILAMPVQPWVLLAADSYAHYASLPIGLIGLATLVELGSRSTFHVKIGRGDQHNRMLNVGGEIG